MKSKKTIEIGEDRSDALEIDGAESVDAFIRELEAKEKDLHISAEMVIEITESEIDDSNLPVFLVEDLAAAEKSIEVKSPVTGLAQAQLKGEIAELETTLSKFKAERIEILERARRQMQDFDSYRNRMERERHETFSVQMVNLAGQMLPVLDNLNRALDYGLAMKPEKRAEIEPFFDGIVLVNQQVNDVLAGMGVQPIMAVGEQFDPHFHEAVATEENDDLPANLVTEELLRGYRIGNRVIRHSMVKVVAAKPSAASFEAGTEDGLEPVPDEDFVPSLDPDEDDEEAMNNDGIAEVDYEIVEE